MPWGISFYIVHHSLPLKELMQFGAYILYHSNFTLVARSCNRPKASDGIGCSNLAHKTNLLRLESTTETGDKLILVI